MTKVRDLMKTEVVTLQKGQAIPLAQELMRMLHIRNLPVIDDNGKLVGLVTQPSLLAAQVELLSTVTAADPVEVEFSVPVAKVMTTDLKTVTPDTDAADALRVMLHAKEGSVPVVEDDKLVGLVTGRDFLELALKNIGEPEEHDTEVTAPEAKAAAIPPGTAAAGAPAATPVPARSESSAHRWLTMGLLAVILLLTMVLVVKEVDWTRASSAPPPDAGESEAPDPSAKEPAAQTRRTVRRDRATRPRPRPQRTAAEAPSSASDTEGQTAEGTPPPSATPPATTTTERWMPEPIPQPRRPISP